MWKGLEELEISQWACPNCKTEHARNGFPLIYSNRVHCCRSDRKIVPKITYKLGKLLTVWDTLTFALLSRVKVGIDHSISINLQVMKSHCRLDRKVVVVQGES